MVGMESVASQVDGLIARVVNNQRREAEGLKSSKATNHLIFTGNPGTGKTTVAREIARAYHALGIVPKDKVVEAKRVDFVGGYAGQTALKTKALFEKARGGVLFIDEAYALKQGDGDSYGQEAVDTLLAEMENHRGDTVVILAGYPREMQQFLTTNPGLKSRLPQTIHFPDYNADSMRLIMRGMLKEGDHTLANGAAKPMREHLRAIAASESHGNARDLRNFYDRVVDAQSRRLAYKPNPSRKDLQMILPEDVEAAIRAYGVPAKKQKVRA